MIGAALVAGVTGFDTAHAYGRTPGASERQLAAALRDHRAVVRGGPWTGDGPGAGGVWIVTKGGMARPDGAWVPDGRARTIRADGEAARQALDGLPIALFLLHAPDPRTPWATSLRALARLVEDGLVGAVGVANVSRAQLDQALDLAPIRAVQVACSLFDDGAERAGVLDRCTDAGVTVLAHSPLGGPRRAAALHRRAALRAVAERHRCSPARVALAWLLQRRPAVVPVPGTSQPRHVADLVGAEVLRLEPEELAAVEDGTTRRAFPEAGGARRAGRSRTVHLVMGIPGAGKTRLATEHTAAGALRLNRDERGGTLRAIAQELDTELGRGDRTEAPVVLDNTYLTRASRSLVIEVARRHGAEVRCQWLDTPLVEAQRNLVERLLDRFGALPDAEQLHAARREPGLLLPAQHLRAARQLEPPQADEGFAVIERIDFRRVPLGTAGGAAAMVAAAAVDREGAADAVRRHPGGPVLLFDWLPDHATEADHGVLADRATRLRRLLPATAGQLELAWCPHGGGPPRCWCRPPLPGLVLAFCRRHGIDPARTMLIGTSAAHRRLAAAVGATAVLLHER